MTLLRDQTELPTEPMVSVAITSYNGERTIAATLESVLRQSVPFPVEIVIGDDASSDGTAAVAQAYRDKYPNVIRLQVQPKNVGIQRNYFETFAASRGRYIAWLDSDDWWTDPEKLRLQVEVLEADPNIVIACHYVRWVTSDGDVKRERYPELPPGRYGEKDILRQNFLPSPSVVFRNGLQRLLPDWFFDAAPLTDWPLYALAAQHGDIVLMDRVMADYRLSPNGSFWGRGDLFWYRLDARFYDFIDSSLSPASQRIARSEQGKRYERLAYHLRQQGDFLASRQAAWKAFTAPAPLDNIPEKLKSLLASTVRETQWRLKGSPQQAVEPR